MAARRRGYKDGKIQNMVSNIRSKGLDGIPLGLTCSIRRMFIGYDACMGLCYKKYFITESTLRVNR
jgi:hypothetical protein